MILLQLSSAQGPEECCLAVKKALDRLIKEAARQDVAVTVLETETGRYSDTLRSALISLDGDNAWALGVLPLMSRNNRMQSVMRRCVRRGRAVNMSIKPTRRYAPRIWHPVLA